MQPREHFQFWPKQKYGCKKIPETERIQYIWPNHMVLIEPGDIGRTRLVSAKSLASLTEFMILPVSLHGLVYLISAFFIFCNVYGNINFPVLSSINLSVRSFYLRRSLMSSSRFVCLCVTISRWRHLLGS